MRNRVLQGLDESVPEEDVSVGASPLKAIDADETGCNMGLSLRRPAIRGLNVAKVVSSDPSLFQYHAWLLSGSTSKQQVIRRSLRTGLSCPRKTPQDASTMPSGKSFVVGVIDSKQILSQPMCP